MLFKQNKSDDKLNNDKEISEAVFLKNKISFGGCTQIIPKGKQLGTRPLGIAIEIEPRMSECTLVPRFK